MRKTKITALALGLIIGATTLSGCSEEAGTSMNYVDVGALQNASLPEITAVNLENGGNPGADPDGSGGADPGNSSGGQPSESSGGASSGESGGASSNSTSGAPAENKTAEIVIPKTSEYGIYIAEFSAFDPEKVKTALWGDVSITPEIIDLHDDHNNVDYKAYNWENGDLRLHADSYNSIFQLSSNLSTWIPHIFTEPNYNHDGAIEEYKRLDEPLDFCTPEQAVNDIRGKLAECGFNVSADADVYALHQDDMQRIVDEQCAKGHFYDPDSLFDQDRSKQPLTSYTVKKSQECYYIVFNEEFGGVPIYNYHHSFETIKDLTIFHPKITAVYSADGLLGLYMSEYRGKITESEKVTQLISPESAAQVIKEKYSDMGASKVEFGKVELMYALTPNTINGKINILKAKLTPAWVCTVYYTEWRKDKRQQGADGNVTVGEGYFTDKQTVLIDAVTGAEII